MPFRLLSGWWRMGRCRLVASCWLLVVPPLAGLVRARTFRSLHSEKSSFTELVLALKRRLKSAQWRSLGLISQENTVLITPCFSAETKTAPHHTARYKAPKNKSQTSNKFQKSKIQTVEDFVTRGEMKHHPMRGLI